MSIKKRILTDSIQKHDIEFNWLKAVNFIPPKGMFIVYDRESDDNGNLLEGVTLPTGRTHPFNYHRIKIGDGEHKVSELPFIKEVGEETHEGGEIFNTYKDDTDNNLTKNQAISVGSHAEGNGTIASGTASHAEGLYNSPKSIELNITNFSSNIYYESSDITIDSNNQLTYNLGAEIINQNNFSVQVNLASGSPYLLAPNTYYIVKYKLSTNMDNTPLSISLLRGTQLAYSPNAPKVFLTKEYPNLQNSGTIYEITQSFSTPSQFDTDNTSEKRIKNRLFFRIMTGSSSPQSGVLVKLTDLTIEKPYLSTIGNGTSDSDRKNAMTVHYDGHAEIQTMGDTDNSVVIRSYAHNTFANALKGSKSGKTVDINDISPVTHNISVQLSGYRLGDEYVTYAEGDGWATNSPLMFENRPSMKIRASGTTHIQQPHYLWFNDGNTTVLPTPSEIGFPSGETCYAEFDIVGNSIAVKYYRDSAYTDLVCQNTNTLSNNSGVIGIGFYYEDPLYYTVKSNVVPITDFSSVTVSSHGKNLFSGFTKGIGLNPIDGSEITNSNYATSDYIPVDFSKNHYYISGLPTTISNFVAAYNANKEFLGRTDSSDASNISLSEELFGSGQVQGTAYLRVTCYKTSTNAGTIDDIDDCNIQLEIGSTATKYEPYNGAEYTPNADGTVEGIASLYPTTILSTDTYDVTIDCEYNRDINKAFDELKQAIISLGGNI